MPVFPGQQQMISTDVPGAPPHQSAGLVGDATARLGETVTQGALSIFDKMQSAEASDAVFSAKNADDMASEQYKANLLKTSPDGYYRDANGKMVENSDQTQGKYQTITQKYRDWANDRYKTTVAAMPNNIATQSYKQQGGVFFTGEIDRVFGEEQQRRVSFAKENEKNQSVALADRFLTYPSTYMTMGSNFYPTAQDMVAKRFESAKNGVYDPTTAQTLAAKDLEDLSNSNMGGYIQSIADTAKSGNSTDTLPLIRDALAVLDGKDPASIARKKQAAEIAKRLGVKELSPDEKIKLGVFTLSESMKPDEKEHRINQLLSISKQSAHLDMSNWENFIREARAGAATGDKNFENNFHKAIQMGQVFKPTGQLTQDEIVSKAGGIIADNAIYEAKTPFYAMLPTADQAKKREDTLKYITNQVQRLVPKSDTSDVVGNQIIKESIDKYDAAIESNQREYAQDSAAYVVKYYKPQSDSRNRSLIGVAGPLQVTQDGLIQKGIINWTGKEFGAYLSKVDQLVKAKEPGKPDEWRVAPESFSKYVGSQLMDPHKSSPEDKAIMLSKMYQAAPERWASFVNQMIKDKSVDPRWEYAKIMPTMTVAKEFISTLMVDESKLKQQFENSFASTKGGYTSFDKFRSDAISPSLRQWVNGVMQAHQGDPLYVNMQSSLVDFATLKASQIYIDRGGKLSAQEAGDLAYKALIGNAAIVTQSKQGGFFSTVAPSLVHRIYPRQLHDGSVINEDAANVLDNYVASKSNDKEFYQKMGAASPVDYTARIKLQGLDPTTANDHWFTHISKDPEWIVDRQHEGFNVYYRDEFNGSRKVVTVLDKNGARVPLFIPFSAALVHNKNEPLRQVPRSSMSPNSGKSSNIPSSPFEKGP